MTEDFAFLLGALSAEGTIRPNVIEFTNTLGDFADAFQAAWGRVFPTCKLHTFLREPVSYGKKPFYQMQVVSTQVIAFLNALGLGGEIRDAACSAGHFPVAAIGSRRVFARALRGRRVGGTFGAKFASRRLVRQEPGFAPRRADRSTCASALCHHWARKKREGTFRLGIVGQDNLQRFQDKIGFASSVKQNALTDAISTFGGRALSKTDFVPFLADFVRENALRGHREWLDKNNIDRPDRLNAALPRLAKCAPCGCLRARFRIWHGTAICLSR